MASTPSSSSHRRKLAMQRALRELRMLWRGLTDADRPVLAQIIPTRRCNLACTYCNEYDSVSKPVPTDEMLARIDKLADLGVSIVTFSGGEPLLHPDLDDQIRRIRDRGMIASLITNGYFMVPDRIQKLNDAGLEYVQISIDNVQPDDVSKKSLKVLDKKLEWMAEYADFHVNINSVVGGGIENPEDAWKIAQRAVELGFTSTVGIIHDGSGQLKPLAPHEREVFDPHQGPEQEVLRSARLLPEEHRRRETERLALPRRGALPLHLRGRACALLLAAARLPGHAACRVLE